MSGTKGYQPLTSATLSTRLGSIAALVERIGHNPSDWKVWEVGDGNLNLVFIVEGQTGAAVVKQALPYVRLVGESWPLPLKRAFFEHAALVRQERRDPGLVPEIWHFDEEQALIVMEFLTPHVILRRKLIDGERVDGMARALGLFCARTAFRGSDLAMDTAEKKADAAMFAGNVELMSITEGLVFTDPYFDAEMNRHTDGLDPVVAKLRGDVAMKAAVQGALMSFTANAETLCHGDLHTGSVMCTETETRVIDPEFGFYGPMGFDLGMLVANFLMAYFSQPGHRSGNELTAHQNWILRVIEELFFTFHTEFARLWNEERNGILFPRSLFEDQGQSSDAALETVRTRIWDDAMRFCGIEMHRRVLSLAHNADFEFITDLAVRVPLEARNLMMGRELVLTGPDIRGPRALTDLARRFNEEDFL